MNKFNIFTLCGVSLFFSLLGFWVGWEKSNSATAARMSKTYVSATAYAEAIRLKNTLNLRDVVASGNCEEANKILSNWAGISIELITKSNYVGSKYQKDIEGTLTEALSLLAKNSQCPTR